MTRMGIKRKELRRRLKVVVGKEQPAKRLQTMLVRNRKQKVSQRRRRRRRSFLSGIHIRTWISNL